MSIILKEHNIQSFSTWPQFFCPLNHVLFMVKRFWVLVPLIQVFCCVNKIPEKMMTMVRS